MRLLPPQALLFALLVCSAGGCADEPPVPPAAQGGTARAADCAVATAALPDSPTHYSCDSPQKSLLCTDGNPLLCSPLDRERGSVPPGGACQLARNASDPAMKYELNDDCAINPDFFWPDWPKGSFCLAEEGRTFCSHACHIDLSCLDMAAASGVPSPYCGLDELCHLTPEAAGIR